MDQLTHQEGDRTCRARDGEAHASHDRHAGHSVAMFRDRLWLSFALTIPVVSFAKILASREINSLHTFVNPPICYDCSPCSASSGCG